MPAAAPSAAAGKRLDQALRPRRGHRRDPLPRAGGPCQCPRASEVMRDDMRAGDAELIEQRRQVDRVAVHRVAEVLRLAGPAVAGHVQRDRPAELARAGEEVALVIGRPGIAVNEDDRLRVLRRPRRQHGGSHAAD